MAETLGSRISELRRAKGMTQEDLAEKMNVSPQAVSKWENGISCPDVMTLPMLSKVLGTSVDTLLTGAQEPETKLVPEEKRKDPNDMLLRIIVHSSDGDLVKINLPLPLVKMGVEMGMKMPQISKTDALKSIDYKQILEMIDKGMVGKLVEVRSAEGDQVEITVE